MSKTPEQLAIETCTVAGPTMMFYIPKNNWEWSFHKSFQMRVQTQHAPCLIHRMMQKLILGIHWRAANENT